MRDVVSVACHSFKVYLAILRRYLLVMLVQRLVFSHDKLTHTPPWIIETLITRWKITVRMIRTPDFHTSR